MECLGLSKGYVHLTPSVPDCFYI